MPNTTVAVPVQFRDIDGDRVITTTGRLVHPGLAITVLPDEHGRMTDLYTLTHVSSGLALTAHGLCDYCVHHIATQPQITAIDWTRNATTLRADIDVYTACQDMRNAADICGQPCTLAIGLPR
ncbi:hypothetical protein OHA72_18320 [Dactylosporangium sp. NBC_01737]|uniref:hypothetical protein n=1 Tax=Dactylosporangium sp. NBC_01737 TaxID=2975959 RepID=UPI002E0F6F7B|nr:hypothetical protein OHA72_18320 [Dactylosporangium sp. NBC_01737]